MGHAHPRGGYHGSTKTCVYSGVQASAREIGDGGRVSDCLGRSGSGRICYGAGSRKSPVFQLPLSPARDGASPTKRSWPQRPSPWPWNTDDRCVRGHHTDCGFWYAATRYRELLAGHGPTASMSRRGNCWDNAVVESCFHTLKTEHIFYAETFPSRWLQNQGADPLLFCGMSPRVIKKWAQKGPLHQLQKPPIDMRLQLTVKRRAAKLSIPKPMSIRL